MTPEELAAVRRDYPRWDETMADLLEGTDTHRVDYDTTVSDDGAKIVVRRTVWTKARRNRDRHIVWQGDVMVIPARDSADFIRDFVSSVAYADAL